MERMRVTEVKTFLVGGSWRNWLIVKIETDAGIHGVGEATLEGKSKTVEGAVVELTRYIVGKDPFAIEKHFQEMYRRAFLRRWGRCWTSAISGVRDRTVGYQGQSTRCASIRNCSVVVRVIGLSCTRTHGIGKV